MTPFNEAHADVVEEVHRFWAMAAATPDALLRLHLMTNALQTAARHIAPGQSYSQAFWALGKAAATAADSPAFDAFVRAGGTPISDMGAEPESRTSAAREAERRRREWERSRSDPAAMSYVGAVARLLWVVRNNNDHAMKRPEPDPDARTRDYLVARLAFDAAEAVLRALLPPPRQPRR